MVRNQRDFAAGALFLTIGLAFAFGSASYRLGTPARMGPGFFPLCLGVLIATLGFILCLAAVRPSAERETLQGLDIKVVFCVFGSVVLFAATLYPLGIVAATFLLVVLSSLAGEKFQLPAVLGTAAVLSVGTMILFVWVLRLPLPIWPAFMV